MTDPLITSQDEAYGHPANGEGRQRGDGLADGSRGRWAQASAFSVSQLPGSPYVQDICNSSSLAYWEPYKCSVAGTAVLQRHPWITTLEMLATLGLSDGPPRNDATGPPADENRRRNLLGGAQQGCNSAELVRDGTGMQLAVPRPGAVWHTVA